MWVEIPAFVDTPFVNGSPGKASEDFADEVEVGVVHVGFSLDNDVQLVEAACF